VTAERADASRRGRTPWSGTPGPSFARPSTRTCRPPATRGRATGGPPEPGWATRKAVRPRRRIWTGSAGTSSRPCAWPAGSPS